MRHILTTNEFLQGLLFMQIINIHIILQFLRIFDGCCFFVFHNVFIWDAVDIYLLNCIVNYLVKKVHNLKTRIIKVKSLQFNLILIILL